MNTNAQIDQIPPEVATALLLSGQSMTARFRKVCQMARQRVVEPVSRSTALNVSAPKIGAQRLQARLAKASAAQLHRWHKRTLRRGNRYQDLYSDIDLHADPSKDAQVKWIEQQMAAHDGLCQAIIDELTSRATRGKVAI